MFLEHSITRPYVTESIFIPYVMSVTIVGTSVYKRHEARQNDSAFEFSLIKIKSKTTKWRVPTVVAPVVAIILQPISD